MMSTPTKALALIAALTIAAAGPVAADGAAVGPWDRAASGMSLELAAARHFNRGTAEQDRITEPAASGYAPAAARASATNALPSGPSLEEKAAIHFNRGESAADAMPVGHPVSGSGADLGMLARTAGMPGETSLEILAVRHFNHGVSVEDRITER